jgi:hypothetical protein
VTPRIRVYLAGPISKGDLAHNINQATAAFEELAVAGYAPWCPHWSAFSTGARVRSGTGTVYAVATAQGCGLSHDDWLGVDLSWVAVADAVLRLPGESAGADREVAFARERGIPVFDSAEAVAGYFDRMEAENVLSMTPAL